MIIMDIDVRPPPDDTMPVKLSGLPPLDLVIALALSDS